MGEVSNKQIVISEDLHKRLRVRVATLGLPSIKGYVEAIIEYALATDMVPESEDVPTDEPEPTPEPTPEPVVAVSMPIAKVEDSSENGW
jgi:plasmid stability protein